MTLTYFLPITALEQLPRIFPLRHMNMMIFIWGAPSCGIVNQAHFYSLALCICPLNYQKFCISRVFKHNRSTFHRHYDNEYSLNYQKLMLMSFRLQAILRIGSNFHLFHPFSETIHQRITLPLLSNYLLNFSLSATHQSNNHYLFCGPLQQFLPYHPYVLLGYFNHNIPHPNPLKA